MAIYKVKSLQQIELNVEITFTRLHLQGGRRPIMYVLQNDYSYVQLRNAHNTRKLKKIIKKQAKIDEIKRRIQVGRCLMCYRQKEISSIADTCIGNYFVKNSSKRS